MDGQELHIGGGDLLDGVSGRQVVRADHQHHDCDEAERVRVKAKILKKCRFG
jgi:hypothetical protein